MHNSSRLWPLRALGAIALLGVAADHLYEYFVGGYSVVPTIGTLFLLNGFGAILLAIALIVPWHRVLPLGVAETVVASAALAGIGLAAASLAALLISESTPLFGFMEFGYRFVIVLAIIAEGAAIVVLGAVLATRVKLVPRAAGSRRRVIRSEAGRSRPRVTDSRGNWLRRSARAGSRLGSRFPRAGRRSPTRSAR